MRESQNSPIGIFDSGVGGLTVLRELYRQLPHESILYFADTARLPYGDRTPEEIVQFVREIMAWMAAQKVKMVIMACNTSSALALDIVREEYPFPILGLILPGARAAAQQGKRIGVIATQGTVNSNAYPRAILEASKTAQVWQVGCPEFVPLIEQNRIYDPYTREVVQRYLNPLIEQRIDTLIYGCTHYRHLSPIFREFLSPRVKRVDPAHYVVAAANRELKVLGLKRTQIALPTRFCVSGCAESFAQTTRQWLSYVPSVEKVCLSAVNPCQSLPSNSTL